MKSFFRELVITLILAIAIFLLLQFTVQSFVIAGSSMEPNLLDGERLLINKVVYKFGQPERGDIIIFRPPTDPEGIPYVKRVIGLPGESVEVKDGAVYINGTKLDETEYIIDPPTYTFNLRQVPNNEYFVLGDNRNSSNDSHHGWTASRESIVGKAWLSIWPPSEWGVVPHYPLQEQLEGAAE